MNSHNVWTTFPAIKLHFIWNFIFTAPSNIWQKCNFFRKLWRYSFSPDFAKQFYTNFMIKKEQIFFEFFLKKTGILIKSTGCGLMTSQPIEKLIEEIFLWTFLADYIMLWCATSKQTAHTKISQPRQGRNRV